MKENKDFQNQKKKIEIRLVQVCVRGKFGNRKKFVTIVNKKTSDSWKNQRLNTEV